MADARHTETSCCTQRKTMQGHNTMASMHAVLSLCIHLPQKKHANLTLNVHKPTMENNSKPKTFPGVLVPAAFCWVTFLVKRQCAGWPRQGHAAARRATPPQPAVTHSAQRSSQPRSPSAAPHQGWQLCTRMMTETCPRRCTSHAAAWTAPHSSSAASSSCEWRQKCAAC